MPPIFEPDPPPSLGNSAEQLLLKYIMEQFQKLGGTLEGAGMSGIPELHKEPTRKTPRMIVVADGTHWNPGNGRGVYIWLDNIWVPLSVVPTDPGDEEPEPPPPPPPPPAGTPRWQASFETDVREGGLFALQSASSSRATLVGTAREGSSAVQLTTQPGDNNIAGSGTWERCDLSTGSDLETSSLIISHGDPDDWVAHSFFLPDNFKMPTGTEHTLLFDWHENYSYWQNRLGGLTRPGQANFHVEVVGGGKSGAGGVDALLRIRKYGGQLSSWSSSRFDANIEPVQKGIWYDFVHYFRWRNDNTGITKSWLRKGSETTGRLVMDHSNAANMYDPLNVYLKLANYHTPYNQAQSVIHDRIKLGANWDDVSDFPLEGVP